LTKNSKTRNTSSRYRNTALKTSNKLLMNTLRTYLTNSNKTCTRESMEIQILYCNNNGSKKRTSIPLTTNSCKSSKILIMSHQKITMINLNAQDHQGKFILKNKRHTIILKKRIHSAKKLFKASKFSMIWMTKKKKLKSD
jgi:hypothetical protein